MRIGVDLDNTLADFTKNTFKRFQTHFGVKLTRRDYENISTGDFSTYFSSVTDLPHAEIKKWMYDEMDTDGFFFLQDPVDDFEYFYDLYHQFKNDIDLFFVTSVPVTSTYAYRDKYKWVVKNMDIKNPQMIFTKFKYLVGVDVLIDDHSDNCDDWLENVSPISSFILFPQPYNDEYYQSLDTDSGVYRPEGWNEICDILIQTLI